MNDLTPACVQTPFEPRLQEVRGMYVHARMISSRNNNLHNCFCICSKAPVVGLVCVGLLADTCLLETVW